MHLRCLRHDRGYPRRDGCLEQLHLGHHRSLGGFLGHHRRDAERSRLDDHLVPDALRLRRGRLDGHLELLDAHRGHPWARLDAANGVHQGEAPGRGYCHPCEARLDEAPGTGCCHPDADAAWAYRSVLALRCHPLRGPQARLRRVRKVPALRALLHPERRDRTCRPLPPRVARKRKGLTRPRRALLRGRPQVRAPRLRRRA